LQAAINAANAALASVGTATATGGLHQAIAGATGFATVGDATAIGLDATIRAFLVVRVGSATLTASPRVSATLQAAPRLSATLVKE
jgi:hypothetical protein